ncbi:MAG: class I SAM-dependent methyltransferase [bacterium]
MAWYKDWFGEDYLRVYPHRDAAEAKRQVDFVTRTLDFQPKQKILDLGCGNGRHASELASRGYDVTCLDLSSELLSVARRESSSEPCCIHFVRADMRNIPFASAFDSVVSFFTTFGYFKSDEENIKTLHSIAGALKPQGTFLQDYVNKSYVVENLVPIDSRRQDGFEIVQERFYNRTDERIEKKITLKENSRVREYFESVRLYTLEEMKNLLAKTDLRLEKTFGDFDGSPFSAASPRLILIGRKERHS